VEYIKNGVTMGNLNTNKTIGTDSVEVLQDRTGLNIKRTSYVLTNISAAGQVIYIFIGEQAATSKGIPLYVGGSLDRTINENPQQEQFLGIASAAGAILSIQEETQ